MSEIKLSLGNDLPEVISASILHSLSGEKRDELIQWSIKKLLEVDTDNYRASRKTTRIQDIFLDAVQQAARTFAEEIIKSDPTVKSAIESLIRDSVKSILESETREAIIGSINAALQRGLDRY